LADSDREHDRRAGEPANAARRLYRFLTRPQVLAATYIFILCTAFLLETRAHRNLFYALGMPLFLLHLRSFDWRWLRDSPIALLALGYLGYFLLSAWWSDSPSWAAFADLLRVSVLVLLFFVTTLQLAVRDPGFPDRLFRYYALAAGITLVAVFAAATAGLLPFDTRFTGFGLATHPIIGATLYGAALLACAFALLPCTTDRRMRLVWIGFIVLCAAFMLVSGSRGPLLALAAALLVGLAIADRRIAVAVAALIVAGIAAGALFDLRAIEILYERSQSGHFEIWQQALAAIAERPWFGHGSLVDIDFVAQHGSGRSPHNLLLANQLYGGLPATLLLAALLVAAGRQGWRAARAGEPIYLVLLVFACTASLFDTRSLVQNLGREWITLWLPIALLAGQESLRRRTHPS
jgi:O-antigen ligase